MGQGRWEKKQSSGFPPVYAPFMRDAIAVVWPLWVIVGRDDDRPIYSAPAEVMRSDDL